MMFVSPLHERRKKSESDIHSNKVRKKRWGGGNHIIFEGEIEMKKKKKKKKKVYK